MNALSYGPFAQQDTIDGVPVMVGGKDDQVSVHLERSGEDEIIVCTANGSIAKQIAAHLFTTVIRVEGIGRWFRQPDGQWEMRHFRINSFEPLAEASEMSLKQSIEQLRAIPAAWKELDDPVAELLRMRS